MTDSSTEVRLHEAAALDTPLDNEGTSTEAAEELNRNMSDASHDVVLCKSSTIDRHPDDRKTPKEAKQFNSKVVTIQPAPVRGEEQHLLAKSSQTDPVDKATNTEHNTTKGLEVVDAYPSPTKEELKRLQENLEQVKKDYAQNEIELQQKLDQSNETCKHKDGELERLKQVHKQYIAATQTEHDKSRNTLEKKLAATEKENNAFKKDVASLSDEKIKLQKKIAQKKSEEKERNASLEKKHKEDILQHEKNSSNLINSCNQQTKATEKQRDSWRNAHSTLEAKYNALETKFRELQADFNNMRRENKELVECLQEQRKQNKELDNERSTLVLRLSKIAGAKLTTNNANIADLSDENRPTKLAEKFSELYDNEWTDAFEEVCSYMNEGKSVPYMLQLLQRAFAVCTDMAKGHIESMKESATTVKYTTINPVCPMTYTRDTEDISKTTDTPFPSDGNDENGDSTKATDTNAQTDDNSEQESHTGQNAGNLVKRRGGDWDQQFIAQQPPGELAGKEVKDECHSDKHRTEHQQPGELAGKEVEDECHSDKHRTEHQQIGENTGPVVKEKGDSDKHRTKQQRTAEKEGKVDKEERNPDSAEHKRSGENEENVVKEGGDVDKKHTEHQWTGENVGKWVKEEGDRDKHNNDNQRTGENAGKVVKEEGNPDKHDSEHIIHTIIAPDGLPEEFLKQIMDMRKSIGVQIETLVTEEITKTIAEEFTICQDQNPLTLIYIRKCVQLCWSMGLKDPPVYMNIDPPDEHTKFDTEVYKAYTKTGKRLHYVVWPALYLHKGGPLLSKGVAQGEGGK